MCAFPWGSILSGEMVVCRVLVGLATFPTLVEREIITVLHQKKAAVHQAIQETVMVPIRA